MADTDDFDTRLARAKSLVAGRRVPEAKALLNGLKAAHPGRREPFEAKADLFLRTGWHRKALAELRAMPLADAPAAERERIVFRAMRVAHYLAAAGSNPRFPAPRAQPPLEQAVVVMMIRDEADIIRPNLDHHYTLGFRNFVILLNNCRDETPALVAGFQADHMDALVCGITDPVEGYYQADKTQAAVEFARIYCRGVRRPVTWRFIIDADEFITVEQVDGVHGLIGAAESGGKDFIGFHLCNATSSADQEYHPGSDPYAHFDVVCGSHGYINAKNAFRLDRNVTVKMGNHSLFYDGISIDRGLAAGEHGARNDPPPLPQRRATGNENRERRTRLRRHRHGRRHRVALAVTLPPVPRRRAGGVRTRDRRVSRANDPRVARAHALHRLSAAAKIHTVIVHSSNRPA
jgi:hypothetical protein